MVTEVGGRIAEATAIIGREPLSQVMAAIVETSITKERAKTLFRDYAGQPDSYEFAALMPSTLDAMAAINAVLPSVSGAIGTDVADKIQKLSEEVVDQRRIYHSQFAMIWLWRRLKPLETRAVVTSVALTAVEGSSDVPECLIKLLKQAAHGRSPYHM